MASLEDGSQFSTLYVRIDKKDLLLKGSDEVIDLIDNLFNLLVKGEISQAIKQAKQYQRDLRLSYIKNIMIKGLKGVYKFVDERDFTISFADYIKLEIKRSGG